MNIFKKSEAETIVKVLMTCFVYLPVSSIIEVVLGYINGIAAAICSLSSLILYKFICLGLEHPQMTAGGIALKVVSFVVSRFLPKLYDSIKMIIFGLTGKRYFVDYRLYGNTFYSK